jgi:hypothetical protein
MSKSKSTDSKNRVDVKASPALVLVKHVWENVQQATGHSWTRLNAAMTGAASLAIEAGLRFDPDDMATIRNSMRGSYWFRGEGHYTTAVKYGNTSACASYEKMVGRPPFVFGGSRLAVLSDFEWPGVGHVRVTSFADDGKSLIACSYRGDESVPKRRVAITIEEMRAAEKGRVKTNEEARELLTLQRALRYRGAEVSPETVAAWSKDQRDQALLWAERRADIKPAFVIA